MIDYWPYLVIFFIITIAIHILWVKTKRRKDYREIIEPILKGFGYKFISSTTPEPFDTGPFPKTGYRVLGIQINAQVGSGVEYRIVRILDLKENKEKESWVRLNFEAFIIKSVTVEPELAMGMFRYVKQEVEKEIEEFNEREKTSDPRLRLTDDEKQKYEKMLCIIKTVKVANEMIGATGPMPLSEGARRMSDLEAGISLGRLWEVKIELQKGADVNEENSLGTSPLHQAIEKKQTDIVSLLLEFGADIHKKTSDGISSTDLAKDTGNQDIMNLLQKKLNE